MEFHIIIEAFYRQENEAVYSQWGFIRIELNDEVTFGGGDGGFIHLVHIHDHWRTFRVTVFIQFDQFQDTGQCVVII